MFNNLILLTTDASAASSTSLVVSGILMIAIFVIGYFVTIRPQQKQQKKLDELIASIEVGDTVTTTAGFFGTVVSLVDENVVVVEFGNNKQCRIPMKKTSIVEIEKQSKN